MLALTNKLNNTIEIKEALRNRSLAKIAYQSNIKRLLNIKTEGQEIDTVASLLSQKNS